MSNINFNLGGALMVTYILALEIILVVLFIDFKNKQGLFKTHRKAHRR